MTLQHVISLADVTFPVIRTVEDGSILFDAAGRLGRFIPKKKKIITTDRKGRIKSIQLNRC